MVSTSAGALHKRPACAVHAMNHPTVFAKVCMIRTCQLQPWTVNKLWRCPAAAAAVAARVPRQGCLFVAAVADGLDVALGRVVLGDLSVDVHLECRGGLG